jgi:response regulator RpfG family c-di-GMP phosphodiesterase
VLNLNIFSNLRVLYVDDEPENLHAFSYALIDECEVATFQSPEEALRAITDDPRIAVVVADIRMPEMDGFSFLHRAGQINPFTANVILTGHTDESLAIKALNGRVCGGYYKKDYAFSGDNLVRIVRDAGLAYAERHSRELLTANATVIVKRLMRLRDKTYSHEHVQNVELLCRYLLPYLDLPLVDKEVLVLAATFHDIGRLVGSDEAGDEVDLAKRSVAYSDEILRGLRGLEKCWLGAVDHHEAFDGTGFPAGKKGAEISLFGRILAVAGFFDAMASERSFRKPVPTDQVVALVQEQAGRLFDPIVVQAFVQMWRDNPQLAEHYRQQNAGELGDRKPATPAMPLIRAPALRAASGLAHSTPPPRDATAARR